ncbi:hypothetical protein Poly30_42350 [Planctomycetes bacterium Poly30]|uniref:Peptidase C-terminal archaeal/bacterial domain-containing protein n=1 Tax=Saltatorellus ferox TaxID=2528018 RepID=A0A518EX63_9BACT|nr:hypothetical protein Poly30_42350 [Planctomycetes bacterium Poly30]
MMKTPSFLLAAMLASPALAQGTDDCVGATPLTSGAAVAFDTTIATLSAEVWPCAASGGPDLWFQYTSTLAGGGLISFETCGSSYDTSLEIFSGACGALTSLSCNDDACGLQSTLTALAPAAGTSYFVRVGGYNGATGAGTLLATEIANPCTGPDDAFEDNDTCATSVAVPAGYYPGLVASTTDSDFYSITVQPSQYLSVSLVDEATVDLDLNQFDSSCNLVTTWFADGFTYQNVTGSPEQVRFEVFVNPAAAGVGCLSYDMNVRLAFDPDCSFPDAFEDSDDCTTAAAVTNGTYTGLSVEDGDNDYYAVTVANGETIEATIFFIDLFADVDLYLWDPNVACDTNVAGQGTGTGALSVGFSTTDNETVSYTNTTGASQNLIIEVDMFSGSGCNEYDLLVSDGTIGPGGIGTAYCTPNANSTGGASSITAVGSRIVATNDVTLSVTGLPLLSFGFFIVSDVQGFVMNPAGSSGNLCLTGAIGRYVGPGQIQNTGTSGMISLGVNLQAIPGPMGFRTTAAGDTWNFQAWHRDSSATGPTSNFSNGTSILFQ